MWWKKFFRSFRYAGAGVARAVKTQRNLRVHLTAMGYALWLGGLAELTSSQWGLLFLCCGLVISLELVNTAVEALCDRVTREWDPLIKTAKDAAAGGVLVAAIAALGVGLALFGPWVLRGGLWEHPWALAAMGVCLIPAVLFVRWDGK